MHDDHADCDRFCAVRPDNIDRLLHTTPARDNIFGDNESLVWTRQGEEEQEADFSASPDKQTVFIPEAGHFPMFERTAPIFDSVMSGWLASRFPGA